MLTPQKDAPVRPFAGLYLRTQSQTRFWGWSSRGWGSLHSTKTERPTMGLAAWLRQAHARLDNDESSPLGIESATVSSQLAAELDAKQPPRNNRKLEFVCNRRMIGLLIR